MKLISKIFIAFWIALLGIAAAQSAVLREPGSPIGSTLNAGYDAPGRANGAYDNLQPSSLDYDAAQRKNAADSRNASEPKRPSLGRVAKLPAAESAPTGTALASQLGQEGEQAVGITGPKVGIEMPSGVMRFPDQFDAATNVLDEVKNVQSLSYTQQLRDYTAFTQQNGGTFNLWVRPSTQLSGPLQQAIDNELINLNYIPGAK